MTNGATKPQIPESTRSHEEVALDRAVSELFFEFGLVIPAPVQKGMTNIEGPKAETFTQRMMTVLQQHAPETHNVMEKYFSYKDLHRQQHMLKVELKKIQSDIAIYRDDKVKTQELQEKELGIAERIGLIADKIDITQKELRDSKINWTAIIGRLEQIEDLLATDQKEQILPREEGVSYGSEFVKILK